MSWAAQSQTESTATLFSGSRRLVIAEHFGIPYDHDGGSARPARPGLERLRASGGTELLWVDVGGAGERPVAAKIEAGGSSIPIFAHVLADAPSQLLLEGYGGTWSRAVAVTGQEGGHVGSIWTERGGGVFLPFDPDQVCHSFWSERYMEIARGAASRRTRREAIRAYYALRGLLPRSTQIWLRRHYARIQMRTPFPRWPIETALHDFFELFASILADVAGEPLPQIAPWPDDHTWALALSHDVETDVGLAALDPVLDLERGLGLRSSWNFVPRRYEVDADRIRALVANGFEVGVHGLHHDGRDLESLARVQERLPGIREAAERWDAVGFRSPATRRRWELMPLLGFDYDASYPDTDPFEPQDSGCCTWLPFFNEQMVELPLTMPQDHTLFVILRQRDESTWVEKADFLRDRGGLAMIDTHPDYLIDDCIMGAYRRLLERYATDPTAWKALPRDVSAWWRRRAASRIERADAEWIVTGPAAGEARVELVEGKAWR
jgi:hypothetical protein